MTRQHASSFDNKRRWNNVVKPSALKPWQNPIKSPRRYGKTFIYYVCEEDGTEFTDRFCPKCGLEAKDFKKFHPI